MTTTTRSSTKIFSFLLLALSAVAVVHAFQPVSFVSISNKVGGLTNQKQQQQQHKQWILPSTLSKPQMKKDKVPSAVSLSSSALEPDASAAAASAATTSLVAAQQASTTTTTTITRSQQQVDVLQRSTVVAISCVTTWAMATYIPGMNVIQASSIQGLLACAIPGLVPSPFCAASFCGSFAGMSAQTVTFGEASLLGFLCSIIYYFFERPNKKLQLGKGGRLGTIAFLANVLYFGIRQGSSQFGTWLVDIINLLRPSTTVAVVLAATVLNMARSSLVQQQQKQQASSQGSSNSGTVVVATRNTEIVAQKLLSTASKGAIMAALLARLLQTAGTTAAATTALVPLAKSTLAMFAASLAVKKCKPLIVLPVALIGLIGATFLGNDLAAPLYLGAFIGMTGLSQFTTSPAKFLLASFLSSMLLQLGLFAGFGGKLGFLAFVGVNFGL